MQKCAREVTRVDRDMSPEGRAREDALAIIAHDLRTPLSTIAMAAEVLAAGALPGGRQADMLHAIQESVKHAEHLIASYLEPHRFSDGASLEVRPEDPAVLVSTALGDLRPQAEAKGVRLGDKLPELLPPVLADPERMRQVLWNVIGNAIKFTPPGGGVVVQATTLENEVRISVTDTGPGIAAAEDPRIFDRYWQGRTGCPGGFGLGLSIAQRIVERHGGRIWAESEVGSGTRIHFTLPRAGPRSGYSPRGRRTAAV